MLHAAYVRSPHGHAVILRVDATTARALPGVQAVYSMADLRPYLVETHLKVGLPSPSYRQDVNRPALAEDEVTYVGEPVAIVIADSRYLAEDAAALVQVDYDPLPAVSDCRNLPWRRDRRPRIAAQPHFNLIAEFDVAYGDVDAAFARAPHVFTERLWQHRGAGFSIECRGVVARYGKKPPRIG